jgi:hypothetical protein
MWTYDERYELRLASTIVHVLDGSRITWLHKANDRKVSLSSRAIMHTILPTCYCTSYPGIWISGAAPTSVVGRRYNLYSQECE